MHLIPVYAYLYRLISVISLALLPHAHAATDPLYDTVERYIRQQSLGLPGKVNFTIGSLELRHQLPPCNAYEAYTPNGARPWGRTSIGVRCLGPNVWTALVPVQVSLTGSYVTTARPLQAGQLLQASDLVTLTGDLSAQPNSVITDSNLAIGKTLKNSLAAGQPLRAEILLAPLLVRQGQSVRILSRGNGFTVSSEGKALNNAAEGQVAQIRMPSGQMVSGIVKNDGSVEISF